MAHDSFKDDEKCLTAHNQINRQLEEIALDPATILERTPDVDKNLLATTETHNLLAHTRWHWLI